MKFRSVWLPLFFVVCLGVAGYIVARVRPVQPMQGSTLYLTQTAYPKDREPILSATEVRYQKADGNWKKETTYSNGRVDVGFGQSGIGVVHVDDKNKKLDYVGMSGQLGRFTADDWRKNPGFVGEETILGYQTFHIHWEKDGEYTDSYMCPALQNYPIKIVSGNARSKTVYEVTKVIPGEPSFDGPPSYPVDTTRYQQIHGNH